MLSILLTGLLSAVGDVSASEMAVPLDTEQQLAADTLRQLVEFESTAAHPEQVQAALEAMADRLTGSGFDPDAVQLLNPEEGVYGLLARYRGSQQRKPVLLMAHIDVVPADPDGWAFPPYTFSSRDGHYFGRGTQDNKTGVAHLVANLTRLKREGFVPDRDLVLVLTGDEETQGRMMAWLTDEARWMIDAEYALNTDAGGGLLDEDGNPQAFLVQTSEKIYQTYELQVTNPGGHSSLPRPDNAINQLAAALVSIANFHFPIEMDSGTRQLLEGLAVLEDEATATAMREAARMGADSAAAERLAMDPALNAILRTTCVATGISGGEAENALPRKATAVINCRILPGTSPSAVEEQLRAAIADDAVGIRSVFDARTSPPSVVPAALQESLQALVEGIWPGVPVLPSMSTGATDGLFVRNAGIPVVGVAGWFIQPGERRSHGLDERIGIREFHQGTEFWYRMLRAFGPGQDRSAEPTATGGRNQPHFE